MTQEQILEQEAIYKESKSQFKIGDIVRHKTASEFKMVIIDFDVSWSNNLYRKTNHFKNPEYIVCKYYNTHTNQWIDKQTFHYVELVLDDSNNVSNI